MDGQDDGAGRRERWRRSSAQVQVGATIELWDAIVVVLHVEQIGWWEPRTGNHGGLGEVLGVHAVHCVRLVVVPENFVYLAPADDYIEASEQVRDEEKPDEAGDEL